MKRAFDEIFRSPYIARLMLAEISPQNGDAVFYTVDYDGRFQRTPDRCAVGGNEGSDRTMKRRFGAADPGNLSLSDALDLALKTWASGRLALNRAEGADEPETQGPEIEDADLSETLTNALETLSVEAVVLEATPLGGARYRALSEEETAKATSVYRKTGKD